MLATNFKRSAGPVKVPFKLILSKHEAKEGEGKQKTEMQQ